MTDVPKATQWVLTLYISGAGPLSSAAVAAVRMFGDDELAGQYDLTVCDAADHPELVIRDRILALPTLVKHSPAPRRYFVGDLSDLVKLREALDVAPPSPTSTTASTPLSSREGDSA